MCSICLDETTGFGWYYTDCAHRFHTTCIERWNQYNATCPLCREPMGKPAEDPVDSTFLLLNEATQARIEREQRAVELIMEHRRELLKARSSNLTQRLVGIRSHIPPMIYKRIIRAIHPNQWLFGPPHMSAREKRAALAGANAMRAYEAQELKEEILELMECIQVD